MKFKYITLAVISALLMSTSNAQYSEFQGKELAEGEDAKR